MVVVDYIDTHRDHIVEGRPLGVEPICAVLREARVQIAPSTYYAPKNHTPSARELRDEELSEDRRTRDPVAPAQSSASARRKKETHATPGGLPVINAMPTPPEPVHA